MYVHEAGGIRINGARDTRIDEGGQQSCLDIQFAEELDEPALDIHMENVGASM
jgi:hypothetical protein